MQHIQPKIDLRVRSVSSSKTIPSALKNHILAALPAADYGRLLPYLEPVRFELGTVVYESGVHQSHVYFPTTSIVSKLYVMENGSSAEIAVVGNEGIVGFSSFMGGAQRR